MPVKYEFYIDLFFLTDFFLNLLSLFLTAVLMRRTIQLARLCASAAVGSLWNCFLVLVPVFSPGVELALTIFGVGSFMGMIAFGSRKLLQINAVLLISSALLGGCLSFSREHFHLSDWECLVFAGLVSGAAGILLQRNLKARAIGRERFEVRLYYRGKTREFIALADSGNRLRVPETGKPVSLISYQDCAGFCESISGGFFIPYRAVGTERGVLFAITFEKMEIKKNGTCITIENPAVAITREPLSSDGDFTMLLPEEYVLEATEISDSDN